MMIAIIFMACTSKSSDFVPEEPMEPEYIVILQPINGFKGAEKVKVFLEKEFSKIYPDITIEVSVSSEKLNLDKSYKVGNKYSAIKILNKLKTLGYSEDLSVIRIGLLDEDLGHKIHNSNNYGIQGLSFCPGNVSVVSSFRTRNRGVLNSVILHEFLHTRGLPHCDNEYCIMKDGKGVGFKHSNYSLCEHCTLILNN